VLLQSIFSPCDTVNRMLRDCVERVFSSFGRANLIKGMIRYVGGDRIVTGRKLSTSFVMGGIVAVAIAILLFRLPIS